MTNLPGWDYDTGADIDTPSGPRNAGLVHSVVSPEAQWARGELPMGGESGFGLPRPKVMREPFTTAGILALADRKVVVDLSQG